MTLPRDALEIGSDGHPYLRYFNVKLRREAVIPIGPALHEQLRRQERVPDRHARAWTAPAFCCLRRPQVAAAARAASITSRSAAVRHDRSSATCAQAEIRDSTGRLASWVHPHRFRHHLGTSMVNEGVPLPVIQRVLDHGSIRDDRPLRAP